LQQLIAGLRLCSGATSHWHRYQSDCEYFLPLGKGKDIADLDNRTALFDTATIDADMAGFGPALRQGAAFCEAQEE
jgi:hypothetical protein